MTLSEYAKYAAIGIVGFFVVGEIYHKLITILERKVKSKVDDSKNDAILEVVYTRDEMTSALAQGITFDHELISTHTQELLENLIRSAQQSIRIAMYIFTNNVLGEALINAHARGVEISVVVDQSMENSKGSKIHDLHDRGIPVRVFRDGTMHLKLCLIDVPFDPRVKRILLTKAPKPNEMAPVQLPASGITITGSLNWTREALLNNEENFIVASDKNICEVSATKFYKIWNSSTVLYQN